MDLLEKEGVRDDSVFLFGIAALYVGFTIAQALIRMMSRQDVSEIRFHTWRDTLISCFEFLAIDTDEERRED
jgi:hypothetical protein